jgi:hypothetical protein
VSETLRQYAARMVRASTSLQPALRAELAGVAGSAAVRARLLATRRMRPAGSALLAIRGEAVGSGSDIRARVYGDVREVPWLRIQEEGGTIHARTPAGMLILQPDGSYRRAQRVTLRGQGFIRDGVAASAGELRDRVRARLRATMEAGRV